MNKELHSRADKSVEPISKNHCISTESKQKQRMVKVHQKLNIKKKKLKMIQIMPIKFLTSLTSFYITSIDIKIPAAAHIKTGISSNGEAEACTGIEPNTVG